MVTLERVTWAGMGEEVLAYPLLNEQGVRLPTLPTIHNLPSSLLSTSLTHHPSLSIR